jgi:hypothetical protein
MINLVEEKLKYTSVLIAGILHGVYLNFPSKQCLIFYHKLVLLRMRIYNPNVINYKGELHFNIFVLKRNRNVRKRFSLILKLC